LQSYIEGLPGISFAARATGESQGPAGVSQIAVPAMEGVRRMSEFLLTDDGVREFAAENVVTRPRTEPRPAPTLAGRARTVLQTSKIYTLRKLQVEDADGAIILRGRVESFYHKQLAQELIRTAIDGVEVINALHVVYNRERSLTESDYYTT
jgi:hypothetical protein